MPAPCAAAVKCIGRVPCAHLVELLLYTTRLHGLGRLVSSGSALRVKAPLRQRRDIDWRPDGDRMESSAPSMMMLMRCRQRGTARLRRLATGRHAPRARGTPGVPKTRLCSKEGEKRRACIFLRAPAVLKGSDVRDKPPAQVYSDFWRVE